MGLITLAIPLFLILILIEILADQIYKTGRYRLNDAINSLSMGAISRTAGVFTKFIPIFFLGAIADSVALWRLPAGAFDWSTLPGLLAFFAVVVAYDFTYYWKHRFGHEFAFFWGSHSAHHQSEDYNLSTALRQTSMGFLLTWIFTAPIVLAGVPAEVYVTAAAINLIYQFWVHTQFVGRMPDWYEAIFVTPSNHRVHHAQNDVYLDKNYGGIFILWDRMFGTFQDELREEPPIYGVRKPLRNWNPFYANLQVYGQMAKDSLNARRWRDRIGVWFSRTGWRPADVAERFPLELTDGKTVEKYDPQVPRSIGYYALFQFLLCVICVPLLLLNLDRFSMEVIFALCLPVWFTLYSIGLLNEGRRYAFALEYARLAAFGLAGVALAYVFAAPLEFPGAMAFGEESGLSALPGVAGESVSIAALVLALYATLSATALFFFRNRTGIIRSESDTIPPSTRSRAPVIQSASDDRRKRAARAARASSSAILRPMPRAPPVITAVRPAKSAAIRSGHVVFASSVSIASSFSLALNGSAGPGYYLGVQLYDSERGRRSRRRQAKT